MKKALLSIATLCCGIVALMLAAAPAAAQATRTWVSGVGLDTNPCTRTAPCATFAFALTQTAAGGQINVLDPGAFGGVSITQSITISAVGVEGGVSVLNTNGIVLAAGPNDVVVLEGLDIQGGEVSALACLFLMQRRPISSAARSTTSAPVSFLRHPRPVRASSSKILSSTRMEAAWASRAPAERQIRQSCSAPCSTTMAASRPL